MAHKSLGFMQLTIVVGYSMFYAFYLITFFGAFVEFPHGYDFALGHLGQVVYYIGVVIGVCVMLARFRRRDSSELVKMRFFAPCALVASLPLPVCMLLDALGVQLGLPVIYAACLAEGFSISGGFAFWDDLTRRGRFRRNWFSHGVVFALGGAVFLACTFASSFAVLGETCIILFLGSFSLLAFIDRRAEKSPDYSVSAAVENFSNSRHLDIVAVAVTAVFGFAFVGVYRYGGNVVFAAMAAAIVIDFALTLHVGKTHVLPFVGTLRIASLLVAIALISIAAFDGIIRVVALSAIVVVWMAYRTLNGGSLMELSLSRKLSLHYTEARGKLASNIGFAMGLAFGILIPDIVSFDLPASGVNSYMSLAAAVVVVAAAILLLPFDNEAVVSGIRTLAPTQSIEFEGIVRDEADSDLIRLIERYRLSPREREVLSYLVAGRNAKHIGERLYISESTAKTHIANIYRKTDVHSQQQLLDLIEDMRDEAFADGNRVRAKRSR
jgi:DNA-binding CsgD family transcriptional regulator